MPAKLVAEEGVLKGLVLSLEDSNQWVIGRDPDACQLLIEDPSTSRKHLICRATAQGIELENLSSSNPVQINEEEVKAPRLLQNGDSVKIGNGVFRFYADTGVQFINTPAETLPKKEEKPEEAINEAPVLEEKVEEAPLFEENKDNPSPGAEVEEKPSETEPEPMKSAVEEKEQTEKEDKNELQHTIFDEEPSDKNQLAEINFGMLETGRWLLKIVGGPNNGAEFSMQPGMSYVIGTDPNVCDVVFHDNSVSRQHARIAISENDEMTIEDLKSRNGTIVDGESLTGKRTLPPSTLVSVGTTSFVVFDREGKMQTIISPLMPSIVKVLKNEEASSKTAETKPAEQPASPETATLAAEPKPAVHPHAALGAFILIAILAGLFLIAGIGTMTLFKSQPVATVQAIEPTKVLNEMLAPFPSVKYSFNKNTGQLLLVGHVLTSSDKSQLLYALQGLKFIKNLNDSGIVIDEYVWREINQIVEKNPDWKAIAVMSASPGHFVVSGYLQTRAQADRLTEYLNANFPYPDLLEKKIIIDEDVTSSINNLMSNHGYPNVAAKFDNGEVTLSGNIMQDKANQFGNAVNEVKAIRGVRNIRNLVVIKAPESSVVNISDKYEVTGISNQAGRLSVVINGRILMKGDILDGMTIININPNYVMLEKEGTKYRIDFSR